MPPLETDAELHLVMYPFLAFGHINPFIQLARKLSAHPGIRITFITTTGTLHRITHLLSDSPAVSVHSIQLPHVDGLPPGIETTADATLAMAELLKRAVDLTQPQVTELLTLLRPHAIIYEFNHQWVPSIARPLGVKPIFFSIFSSFTNAYLVVPSRRSCSGDTSKPPPGFPATSSLSSVPKYQANDFAYIFKSFDGMPCVYDRVVSCIDASDAIIIKSCMEMESPYINYLESEFKKPILTFPAVPEPAIGDLESHWEEWLERFPEDSSVILCSFGSEAFLDDYSIKQLLLGLEMTGLPFIVVLNFTKSGGHDEQTLKKKLPEGFAERVKGRGIVHTGWVRQQQLLRHRKVGLFVTHAGFSSLLEGIVYGCRLVMLPQRGDQFLNASLFAGDLGVGVVVERDEENGTFTKEGVRDAVNKMIMMGNEMHAREKERKLKEFLMNKEVQGMFMVNFVKKLRELLVPGVNN
ncbi:anthocyanidin-3-O-glucoside rhamnosyltransferase-like [Dioscorea cayenensis subsp. rotundata]|uniref:Glycosyltransferase n=1 Tax=Dioscorea cayennensis subsp. rotundata TaxID=55577 RepID=A0AB40BA18_DIOCR|nr:anthocyanidin-3-O-glucoside rhamnosyltransferase-like [Dioscorea cayenensis subsp. rotundata]